MPLNPEKKVHPVDIYLDKKPDSQDEKRKHKPPNVKLKNFFIDIELIADYELYCNACGANFTVMITELIRQEVDKNRQLIDTVKKNAHRLQK